MTNIDSLCFLETEVESKTEPKLVSVDFLDGDESKMMAKNRNQWVNLPRESKWVDGKHIPNLDRLGSKPRIRVAFDREGRHSFRLKIEPGESNCKYSSREKGTNRSFIYTEEERQYTTDPDGTIVIVDEFLIDCCGTNRWRLHAQDEYGNSVVSHDLINQRLIYLVELVMDGFTPPDISFVLSEYEKHGVILEPSPPVAQPCIENIDTFDFSEICTLMERTWVFFSKSIHCTKTPYTLCVSYVNHMMDKEESRVAKTIFRNRNIHQPQKVTIYVANQAGRSTYLWHNVVPESEWYISCIYLPDLAMPSYIETSVTNEKIIPDNLLPLPHSEQELILIPKSCCTPLSSQSLPEGCDRVEIDISCVPPGVGTIILTMNVIETALCGFAMPNTNLLYIATRSYWKKVSRKKLTQALIHEIGHLLEMVCEGKEGQPDRVKSQYKERGHTGSHCHYPLRLLPSYEDVTGATCVMHGKVNGSVNFCVNCGTAVKKVNLERGWKGYLR